MSSNAKDTRMKKEPGPFGGLAFFRKGALEWIKNAFYK